MDFDRQYFPNKISLNVDIEMLGKLATMGAVSA